jgi:ATP-binding cassette subfamily B protein
VALHLPRLLGRIVDFLLQTPADRAVLFRSCAVYLAFALLGAVLSKTMRQLPMRLGPRISHTLRTRLYAHLLSLDESQIRRRRVGDLMTRLHSDVNAVSEMISLGGHSLLRAGFTLGIAFWMMFQRSPPMAGVVALLLPLLMLIGFLLLRSIRERHTEVQEHLSHIGAWCQESFNGLRVIRGLGLEPLRTERFEQLNQQYIRMNLRLAKVEIPAWPLMHAGFMLGNVLLLWVGGRRVISGEISLGTLVEFQQVLMVLQWPALSLSWTLTLVFRGRASLLRLRDILAEAPEVADTAPATDEALPAAPLRFENVSLDLEGRRLLHDLNLVIPPGQILGITGPTGAGKTLLLQLVQRRHDPSAGRVCLGDSDLRDIPLSRLHAHLRSAAQEPVLFSMSLAENLRLAKPDATAEDLDRVIHLAALDSDLRDLPQGLDTLIGERGVNLSGGQRQRCAIARALLSRPQILLLDDSLSAVDTDTEARLLEALFPALRGSTVLLVSHRASALRRCDRVLVLREGRILESGTPDDLIRAQGWYADLDERQRLQARLEADND